MKIIINKLFPKETIERYQTMVKEITDQEEDEDELWDCCCRMADKMIWEEKIRMPTWEWQRLLLSRLSIHLFYWVIEP